MTEKRKKNIWQRTPITDDYTDAEIKHLLDQEKRYAAKTHMLRARRAYRQHTILAAVFDWFAVGLAVTMFIFIVLWAASPDSLLLTFDQAVTRALTYGIPITLGMYGISRATRKGSQVPKGMAEALPYARFGADGKLKTSTVADDKAGNPAQDLPSQNGDNVVPLDGKQDEE